MIMSLISGLLDKIKEIIQTVNYQAVAAVTKPVITKAVFYGLDRVKAKVDETPNEIDNKLFYPVYNDMKDNWDDWFDVLLTAAGLVAVPQGRHAAAPHIASGENTSGGNDRIDGEATYLPACLAAGQAPESACNGIKERLAQNHSRFLSDASERTGVSIGSLISIIIQFLPLILGFFK
ncbi:MAG: hypothetical protein LBQ54_10145 [Planctomycetaceae bacterium]|jgi:hypothetical protein|nr:hypothetical protein [Planctomycetaceae bacterium]